MDLDFQNLSSEFCDIFVVMPGAFTWFGITPTADPNDLQRRYTWTSALEVVSVSKYRDEREEGVHLGMPCHGMPWPWPTPKTEKLLVQHQAHRIGHQPPEIAMFSETRCQKKKSCSWFPMPSVGLWSCMWIAMAKNLEDDAVAQAASRE